MASMGLRTITYTVTPTGITPCTEQDGGVQGEHHITDVVFSLSSELQTKLAAQETAGYTVAYRLDGVDGAGGYYASELLTPADGVLTFPLPRELTGAGGSVRLNLVIAASRESDSGQAVEEMTLYTYTARLRLADSAYGAQGRTAFTQEFSQEITGALAQLQGIQDAVEDAVVHGPKIEDGTWWVWSFDTGGYVDTGVEAAAAVYTAELDGSNYRYDVTAGRYGAAEDIAEGTALLVYVTQGNAPWANLYVDGVKAGSHDGMVPSQYNGGNLYNPGGVDESAKAKGFDQEGYYLCLYTGTYWETRRVGDQYSQAETDALLASKADAAQGVYYGEDNNAADLAERPVTVTEGLVLETGVSIRVRFVNGVTVRGATLNVNGTGAVSMKYRGANFSGNIRADDVIDFVYDGTNWAVIGQFDTDGLVTQLPKSDDVNYHLLCSSSGDIAGTTSYATKNAAFTANPATGALTATQFVEDGTALNEKYVGVTQGVYYGEDNNAAGLKLRPVTVDESFVLETGAKVQIKFVNGVYVSAASLNINGTGDKPLRYRGEYIPTGRIQANEVVTWVYDGAYWCLAGQLDTDALVSQSLAVDDAEYRVLLSGFANDTSQNTTAKKTYKFKANPATGALTATQFVEDGTALSEKYAASGTETIVSVSSDAASPTALESGKTYVIISTVGSNNFYLAVPDGGRVAVYCTVNPVGGSLYAVNSSTTQYVVMADSGVTTNTTGAILAHSGGGTQWGYYRLDLVQAGTVMYITVQGGGAAAS